MNNLDKIYLEKFHQSDDVKSLGWGSKFSQEQRFNILLEINGYCKNDSVLDVGCGYGDLSSLVKNYTGIDLRTTAIKKAIEKYPSMNFISGDIFSLITNKYDWVFASGIFCFKYKWREHAILNIEKMYSLSEKGCAFNFLSANTPGKKINGMKYARISDVVSIIESLTNKFTIRHDYLKNDFTVYLYK